MGMLFLHLRNELWKLFGKKRTYIGFGAFLLAQNAMLLMFRFSHWRDGIERMLVGNGYLAQEYISALSVQRPRNRQIKNNHGETPQKRT